MSSRPADIYVEGRRIGCAYFAGTLSEAVSRPSTSRRPFVWPRYCEHTDLVGGFAYVEFWDEHWPIQMCRDCRSILKGRHPRPPERERPAWELDAEDVIAAQWVKKWPRPGRPRAKKPPAATQWPDAA